MDSYSVQDVERLLRLSRSTIKGLIDGGFVKPARGPRRQYRFSFQDLIVLRTARALTEAKVPSRRVRRALEELRQHLPETAPLSGLSICAVGERVVVPYEQAWKGRSFVAVLSFVLFVLVCLRGAMHAGLINAYARAA